MYCNIGLVMAYATHRVMMMVVLLMPQALLRAVPQRQEVSCGGRSGAERDRAWGKRFVR